MRFIPDREEMLGFWQLHRHERDFPWGGPFGEREQRGPGGRHRGAPMFGRGDLKFALLALVQAQPKHGYEMIKELEERSGGFYTPSAGAIYPTLQMMEDIGWVTSQVIEGKKIYTVTDLGRQALHEHDEQAPPPFPPRPGPGHGPPHMGPFHEPPPFRRGPFAVHELRALHDEVKAVQHLMRAVIRVAHGDPAVLAHVHGVIAQARDALTTLLNQVGTPGSTPPEAPTEGKPPEMV